jgi:hypothetical protein
MSRQPSTSITHLVKTVAHEVFDERDVNHEVAHAQMEEALRKLGRRVNLISACLADEIPPIDECQDEWSTPNAGGFWSDHEEEALICDLRKAIKWMASRRGRTAGAIDARLSQLAKEHRILF